MTEVKETKTTTRTTKAKKTDEPVEQKKEITLDMRVEVFNNTTGRLLYEAKKGNGFLQLDNFMDSDLMTVEELQILKNTARSLLTNGWLYVDDDDVLDFLRLNNIKDTVKSPQLLEDAVDSGKTDEILELFDKLSKSSRQVFYGIIKNRFEKKEFSDAHVIKTVEEKLGVAKDNSLLQG